MYLFFYTFVSLFSLLQFTVSRFWRLSRNPFHFDPTPEAIAKMPPHRTARRHHLLRLMAMIANQLPLLNHPTQPFYHSPQSLGHRMSLDYHPPSQVPLSAPLSRLPPTPSVTMSRSRRKGGGSLASTNPLDSFSMTRCNG
jgi:hypothetical protein